MGCLRYQMEMQVGVARIGFPSALSRLVIALAVTGASASAAFAQGGLRGGFPPFSGQASQAAPRQDGRNPVCVRLEAQLAGVENARGQSPYADQIRRAEDAAGRQQYQLDRLMAQSRQLSCEGGGLFSLFSTPNPQCGPLRQNIQQVRAGLDRILSDIERMRGSDSGQEGQRRAVLAALAQNDCGPQYRNAAAASGGGFFDALMGPGTVIAPEAPAASSGYRTVCVRTCDGYFFPISFSTSPASFANDENVCRRMCPAADTTLFAYRNPGEDMRQAVSINGQPYTSLPNAFRYRTQIDKSCTCQSGHGEAWVEALKPLSPAAAADQPAERPNAAPSEGLPTHRRDPAQKVRSVGPPFLPGQ